jgi:hypothetical protein
VTSASTVFAILASAVIVLGGLVGVVRAIWKIAQTLRDNTVATRNLSESFKTLSESINGRFDKLVERVTKLEDRRP